MPVTELFSVVIASNTASLIFCHLGHTHFRKWLAVCSNTGVGLEVENLRLYLDSVCQHQLPCFVVTNSMQFPSQPTKPPLGSLVVPLFPKCDKYPHSHVSMAIVPDDRKVEFHTLMGHDGLRDAFHDMQSRMKQYHWGACM